MKDILIITGGSVDYNWASEWLENKKFDYVIAADSGLVHADALGTDVDCILGDYDSVDKAVLEKYRGRRKIITYPTEKDYTDTELAIKRAVEAAPVRISIIGATGSRYDHAINNIFCMKNVMDKGIECAIYDSHNKIYLKDKSFEIQKKEQYGGFLSFAAMSQEAVITLKGVKYPAKDFLLKQGASVCQSNEITDDTALVIIKKGILIVFETRD